jgi:acyl carrier protein
MLSKSDVRRILEDRQIFAAPIDNIGDDADLALDSLAVVWLAHRLEEDYGVTIDPDELDPVDFTSVNAIHTMATRQP